MSYFPDGYRKNANEPVSPRALKHIEELEKITLETGKIARQADGAIIATCGETVVIATAVGAKTETAPHHE